MPRFSDQPQGVFSGLEASVFAIAMLAVEIVLLFYLGYVAFLRFDVR
jgi:ABC-type transport system involved in multi-copper enzyme maturation permease subunit